MPRRLLTIIAVGLVFLLLSLGVPVKQEMGWIDAVTASRKHQTYITFGFHMAPLMKTSVVIEPSPLADWLARREGGVEYEWRHVNGTLMNLWGRPVEFGHGAAPPICSLPAGLLKQFVDSSSDKELQRFIEIMRHGTDQEQQAAVEAAADKAFTCTP